MPSHSTNELGLTRLWYLTGEWEGMGKGPQTQFRARCRCTWELGDHFLRVEFQAQAADSDRLLFAEHVYVYYDRDIDRLVADIYNSQGMVERAAGHASPHGHLILATERLSCIPRGRKIRRIRRSVWKMAAAQWAYSVEVDSGEGYEAFAEGHMQQRSRPG